MSEFNVDTATCDELRDWLDRRERMSHLKEPHDMAWAEKQWGTALLRVADMRGSHRYPNTLDAAIKSIPNGWGFELCKSDIWTDEKGKDFREILYQVTGIRFHPNGDGEVVLSGPESCPIAVMYRVAIKCILKDQEASK